MMEFSIFTWYFIVAILAFVVLLWVEWNDGRDLTVGYLIMSLFVSIFPVINAMALFASIIHLIIKNSEFSLIKGRKK